MNRLLRLLAHRRLDESDAHRALDTPARQRLAERVAASERAHSGEIRLCIEPGLPLSYLWRGASARERAIALFGKLRVWDTELNNGVLVYLLLAERAVEIVADRGLARRVPPERWQAIADTLSARLRDGRYEEGLAGAIDAVHALLARNFALAPGEANPNELPDEPAVP